MTRLADGIEVEGPVQAEVFAKPVTAPTPGAETEG